MLKRKQLLIPSWLDEYLKEDARALGVSYSELVRIALCHFFASAISTMDPKQKFSISTKMISSCMKKFDQGTLIIEDARKIIADILCEAKPILEKRAKELKKKNTSTK